MTRHAVQHVLSYTLTLAGLLMVVGMVFGLVGREDVLVVFLASYMARPTPKQCH